MSKKEKVATEEVETQNAEVDTPVVSDEVATEEVETQNAEVDTPVVSDEVATEEVETRTFVDGQFAVKANLKHNGKFYSVGDSITLEEDEAKALLADGTIE